MYPMSRRQFEVLSVLEGATSWGASSVADSFWGAAALACGASSWDLAALGSVPTLVGSFAQLLAAIPRGVRARSAVATSRKYAISVAFFVQASVLALVAFFLVPHSVRSDGRLLPVTEVPGICSSAAILLCAVVHGSVGMAAGPIWTEWVAAVVPAESRGRFFGIKHAAGVLSTSCALSFSAWLFSRYDFAVVFFLAFILRMMSFFFIMLTKDPVCPSSSSSAVAAQQHSPRLPKVQRPKPDSAAAAAAVKPQNPWQKMLKYFVYAAHTPGFWRAVLLFAGTNAASTIASSFFTSYTLKNLHMDEEHYVMLNIASTVSRFIISPVWGVVVDNKGALFTSALSIALMIPLPLILLLSKQSFATAVTFHVLTGVFGAGYDTAKLPVLLALSPKQRVTTAVVQLYNLLNGILCFLASCLSVYFVSSYGSAFAHAPMICFAVSFLFRLIVFMLWLVLSLRSKSAPVLMTPSHSPLLSAPTSPSSPLPKDVGPRARSFSESVPPALKHNEALPQAMVNVVLPGVHEVVPLASSLRGIRSRHPLGSRQQQKQQQQQSRKKQSMNHNRLQLSPAPKRKRK